MSGISESTKARAAAAKAYLEVILTSILSFVHQIERNSYLHIIWFYFRENSILLFISFQFHLDTNIIHSIVGKICSKEKG